MEIRELIKTPGMVTQISLGAGVPRNTVIYWGRRNRIPAERVPAVERATGIPREELRPDLYVRDEPTTPTETVA